MSLISALSVGFQAQASRMQAKSIEAQADAEAKMLTYNASVYEAEASGVRRKAAYDEAALRRQVRSVASTQKARYAASGVLRGGSPTEVIMDTLMSGEMDAMQIRTQGEYDASSLMSRASMERARAKYTVAAGRSSSSMALMSGLGSSLTSAYNFGMFSKVPSSGLLPQTSVAGVRAGVGNSASASFLGGFK